MCNMTLIMLCLLKCMVQVKGQAIQKGNIVLTNVQAVKRQG